MLPLPTQLFFLFNTVLKDINGVRMSCFANNADIM